MNSDVAALHAALTLRELARHRAEAAQRDAETALDEARAGNARAQGALAEHDAEVAREVRRDLDAAGRVALYDATTRYRERMHLVRGRLVAALEQSERDVKCAEEAVILAIAAARDARARAELAARALASAQADERRRADRADDDELDDELASRRPPR